MRAGIYLRQSLDVAEGIERQRDRCAAMVHARGWEVEKEYRDNDTSASKARGRSTGWAQMLADASDGVIDVAVAVNLDRLLRTQTDLSSLIATGVAVTTLEGELDLTSASGEMQASVLTAMARFEVRRKSERQIRANESRARSGKWVGGRRPFGFEADGITVREPEADAVREGFRDLLLGTSLAAIARRWNQQGFVTGQARQARSGHAGEPSPWRADAVRAVLMNPRYAGRVRYKGETLSAPARWPALVDAATFEAVQAVLQNPARRSAGRAPTHLLTGIALCGVCGATAHAGGNARQGVRAYRCSASSGHFARRAEPVEEYVTAVILARLAREDARELLQRSPGVDTEGMRLEAVGVRARLDALAVDFADGTLTASQLRAATERLRTRLNELETRLADAGRVDVLGDVVGAPDVAAAWASLTLDRRRAIIATLMTVTLHPPGRGTRTFRPETVGIDWAR
ncbi:MULTISPECIES: recombinase family protein [unclassified Microbacterium]|uniref:recombinase family protein n=1 Tax=unclassified Microbacterium TaxID=2609290 RepID=UPI000EAAC4CB|nr:MULTISPECIES: recombinase family protein [unclassified Microbacterium]MBT2485738.1 recombinase family protein [Microbacterium sp. ISL-108]RKN68506.1 recombinase family protein [Microbacterium sp. CGR2]